MSSSVSASKSEAVYIVVGTGETSTENDIDQLTQSAKAGSQFRWGRTRSLLMPVGYRSE